ncbi:MAG: isoleucine--tRNA ligase, partial [Candidatus Harrisonbacteria bacterium CG10_big_fil_rev_8_21_14_0_10_44_23]
MLKDIKNFSLPEVEEKVLEKWEKEGTMKKSFEKNRGEKEFVFYEGPPTANGKPGIHHLEARAFKDIITRFKAMQGFHVPRKAGWDTHGLPVEIAVEKALNLKDKQAIEDYGIDKFNAQAKELVFAHLQDWQDFTKRIAFWVDMENPYVTYHNSYIESLWWLFSEINERGYLKKLQKTLPWCPRCQTALSSHELAQPGAYREVTDPSIYVKFPLAEAKSDKPIANSYLLVWTTTPWTLPGNLAVAVDPKLEYKKFEVKNASNSEVEYLISYNQPPEIEGFEVKEVEKISGQELIGLKYQSPFNLPTDALNKLKGHKLHEVWVGDFVTTEDGSGLVHIAPAFGEEDFRLMGIKENLPVTITEKIEMAQGFPGAGKYVKEADRDIVKDLEGRNLLYKFSRIKHEYPHCWRCDNPLFYVVRESWFIEMSQLQKQLIKGNEKINWVPSHIKEGRFGNWLSEIKDWSISRNRYWGTPLPIWVSEDEKEKFVVSSLEDLQKYSPNQNTFYLLRHGEARANIEHVVAAGPEDSPEHTSDLTELGEKQVAQVAKELKKEEIDLIFASPYLRTKKTAQATAKEIGKEVAFDDRLKEIDGGKLNWQPLKEYWALFKDDQEKFDKAPEGGESLADARKRVLEF